MALPSLCSGTKSENFTLCSILIVRLLDVQEQNLQQILSRYTRDEPDPKTGLMRTLTIIPRFDEFLYSHMKMSKCPFTKHLHCYYLALHAMPNSADFEASSNANVWAFQTPKSHSLK